MPTSRRTEPYRAALDDLLAWVQDGVVSRRQLIEMGADDEDIDRMVRRDELYRRHPGVFTTHNGPLTREQREWVAVLVHWPAALTRRSALPDEAGTAVVQVAIDQRRTVKPVDGVVAYRTPDLNDRVDWDRRPPRMRLEHAVIDIASALVMTDPLAAFHVLADATWTRLTSAARIAEVLVTRRVAGKSLLLEMLGDLASGACSVLEREYLKAVERAHGLPEGRRQSTTTVEGRQAYRDVVYDDYDLIVELDGWLFHSKAKKRDADALRDLVARVDEEATSVRLTYGLVFGDPCRTARYLEALLRRRGWTGVMKRCPRCS